MPLVSSYATPPPEDATASLSLSQQLQVLKAWPVEPDSLIIPTEAGVASWFCDTYSSRLLEIGQ